MPCQCGQQHLINGHCSTPGCENRLPKQEPIAVKAKPKARLRKQSARKRREIKETKPIREVKPGERCEICNGSKAVSTHEIPAGSHRHRAVYDRRCQMRLCIDCHQSLQGLPYAMQVAFRVDSFLAAINEAHGSIAVTTEDVRAAL